MAEAANGSLVLHRVGTAAERPTHATRNSQEEFCTPRSSRSASGQLLPLDKDLSWKSANRTFQVILEFSVGNEVLGGNRTHVRDSRTAAVAHRSQSPGKRFRAIENYQSRVQNLPARSSFFSSSGSCISASRYDLERLVPQPSLDFHQIKTGTEPSLVTPTTIRLVPIIDSDGHV
jgi:hypothetical protein